MILRLVRFTLHDGAEPEFMAFSRLRVRDMAANVEGLVDARLARRMEGKRAVVLAMTRWRDYEAMKNFFGDDIDKARQWDPRGEWVASTTIEHLEDELTTEGKSAA